MSVSHDEPIKDLQDKYGQNFHDFLILKKDELEDEFNIWRRKRWLRDCFDNIKQGDDVVEQLHVSQTTFNALFKDISAPDFVLDKQEPSQPGYRPIWGKYLTAQIYTDKGMLDNLISLRTKNGIHRRYDFPFIRTTKLEYMD